MTRVPPRNRRIHGGGVSLPVPTCVLNRKLSPLSHCKSRLRACSVRPTKLRYPLALTRPQLRQRRSKPSLRHCRNGLWSWQRRTLDVTCPCTSPPGEHLPTATPEDAVAGATQGIRQATFPARAPLHLDIFGSRSGKTQLTQQHFRH